MRTSHQSVHPETKPVASDPHRFKIHPRTSRQIQAGCIENPGANLCRVQEHRNAQSHAEQEVGFQPRGAAIRQEPPACIMPFVVQVTNPSELLGVDRLLDAGEVEQPF